jgi:NAD(P)-dependent dehydrogenase (short-subunit alcohol dehydrogenase family)
MGLLDGKVALVTGAGTGIGKGTALRFVQEGAKVVIAARRTEKLQETAALAPEHISWVRMDLNSQEERARALETTVERHGRLDVLVSNAGSQLWKSFADTTDEEIEDIYRTNLASTVRFIKQAVPYLEASRGNIVIVSSTAGRYVLSPSQLLSVYGASKAGLNQFTRAVAPELGPRGVRINAVAPGLTRGEYADEGLEHNDVATQDWIRSVTPLGRMGEPEDIAKVIAFMASDLAAWVTGQVLDASGGWQVAGG